MLKAYYVNRETNNPNNNHEVHISGCQWMPSEINRDYLGMFNSCTEALNRARISYTNVDGCATCCPDCNKG